MRGWIWRAFIVVAKTWSSASQINTSFSLPPLFFFPWLCPLLDVRAAREQMHIGGVTYPTLPLQEAVHRPQSGYSQQSAACSPSGSFAGSLPPQPHSAYFSGMTGPQHPFYNRVRHNRLNVEKAKWKNFSIWHTITIHALRQLNSGELTYFSIYFFPPTAFCAPSYYFVIFILFYPLSSPRLPLHLPSFSPHSLISPIMCITCHGITPTMSPHLCALPLNHPVNPRTPMDL